MYFTFLSFNYLYKILLFELTIKVPQNDKKKKKGIL